MKILLGPSADGMNLTLRSSGQTADSIKRASMMVVQEEADSPWTLRFEMAFEDGSEARIELNFAEILKRHRGYIKEASRGINISAVRRIR